MSQRRRAVTRDEAETPFVAILIRLCDSTGALGAALVDTQGETVDWAGAIDSYEIRVAAAEFRLVLKAITETRVFAWSDTLEVFVRARRRSFAVIPLSEGYAIVLQLTPRCFSLSRRALSRPYARSGRGRARQLPGWLTRVEHWSRVEVRSTTHDPRRPRRCGSEARGLR